jgi:hypothetical protein
MSETINLKLKASLYANVKLQLTFVTTFQITRPPKGVKKVQKLVRNAQLLLWSVSLNLFFECINKHRSNKPAQYVSQSMFFSMVKGHRLWYSNDFSRFFGVWLVMLFATKLWRFRSFVMRIYSMLYKTISKFSVGKETIWHINDLFWKDFMHSYVWLQNILEKISLKIIARHISRQTSGSKIQRNQTVPQAGRQAWGSAVRSEIVRWMAELIWAIKL